jgi:nucleoside phosphorylase
VVGLRVLIVHDRPEILAKIKGIARSTAMPPTIIVEAEDTSSARKELARDAFDLMIVDLTLAPLKGRSEVGYEAVEDFLLEVVAGDEYLAPGDILGITREPNALDKINVALGPHLMAIVAESDDGVWERQLADRIAYVQKSELARLRSLSSRYDYDVAILTALDEEFAPYRNIFELAEILHFPGAYQFVFHDARSKVRRGVLYSVGGAGQAGCASAAQAIIGRFRPRAFFLSGICGGYSKTTRKGDVLLFQSVHDWDTGKWTTPRSSKLAADKPEPYFQPRSNPIPIGAGEADRVAREISSPIHGFTDLSADVKERSNGKIQSVTVKQAIAASGSAVIANIDILNRIRSLNDKIVAVDMESYGFYQACSRTPGAKPEMMCVKAVADYCDKKKNDTLHDSCCYAAAKVVEHAIKTQWRFDDRDR